MLKSTGKFYILLALTIIGFLSLLIPFILLTFFTNENIPKKERKDDKENDKKNKTLIYIFIEKLPDKMKYKEGELFDKTGLILKGYYDDDTYSEIFDYIINTTSPLTIYNREICFIYRGATYSLFLEIVNDDDKPMAPNPSLLKYTLEPSEYEITRFELEDADITNWVINNNDDKYSENVIIERNDASRKYFLSGLDKEKSYKSKLVFYINLTLNADVEMEVSYSQKEEYKNHDYDMSMIYSFIIDEKINLKINDDDKYLLPRNDITKWLLIKYEEFTLSKGVHNITLEVKGNTEKGTPNIDYINFKIEKEKEKIDIPYNDFHTPLQYIYMLDPEPTNIYKYASGNSELSRPKGNLLDFSDCIEEPYGSFILEISEDKSFTNSYKITDLKKKKYYLKNLKLGQKIYYRGAKQENEINLFKSKVYKLTVNNIPPRNLDVPGVENMRDVGGYKTTLVENGIIKQGLYYRSANLDYITEEGKKILKEKLGIKVEIDLREKNKHKGNYIEGIKYYMISIDPYAEDIRFDKIEKEYYKIFTLISQADKKPIVLHCEQGADRTGVMTFALLILLGCEYNDVAKDYLFTNFSKQGYRSINYEFNIWWEKLSYYEGKTKAEQCKSWLMSKGLEESKLEHIRSIFIDGYKEHFSNN